MADESTDPITRRVVALESAMSDVAGKLSLQSARVDDIDSRIADVADKHVSATGEMRVQLARLETRLESYATLAAQMHANHGEKIDRLQSSIDVMGVQISTMAVTSATRDGGVKAVGFLVVVCLLVIGGVCCIFTGKEAVGAAIIAAGLGSPFAVKYLPKTGGTQ